MASQYRAEQDDLHACPTGRANSSEATDSALCIYLRNGIHQELSRSVTCSPACGVSKSYRPPFQVLGVCWVGVVVTDADCFDGPGVAGVLDGVVVSVVGGQVGNEHDRGVGQAEGVGFEGVGAAGAGVLEH